MDATVIARVAASSLLGLAAAGVILCNLTIVARWIVKDDRHVSLVPVVGGGFGAVAIAIAPLDSAIWWCWMAPALDPSWWSLAYLPFYLMAHRSNGK